MLDGKSITSFCKRHLERKGVVLGKKGERPKIKVLVKDVRYVRKYGGSVL